MIPRCDHCGRRCLIPRYYERLRYWVCDELVYESYIHRRCYFDWTATERGQAWIKRLRISTHRVLP